MSLNAADLSEDLARRREEQVNDKPLTVTLTAEEREDLRDDAATYPPAIFAAHWAVNRHLYEAAGVRLVDGVAVLA